MKSALSFWTSFFAKLSTLRGTGRLRRGAPAAQCAAFRGATRVGGRCPRGLAPRALVQRGDVRMQISLCLCHDAWHDRRCRRARASRRARSAARSCPRRSVMTGVMTSDGPASAS